MNKKIFIGLLFTALLIVSCGDNKNDENKPVNTPATRPTTDEAPAKNIPLYFTTMTHMEEDFKDDKIEGLFDQHVAQIRWGMDLFDLYGGKLTIESAAPFALANKKWGLNIMKEVLEKGHGVGTHCGGLVRTEQVTPVKQYAKLLKGLKNKVDELVGAENNKGCSGGPGSSEWVIAAAEAGFSYFDGLTGFAYLSMDESERPQGWTDQAIKETYFHNSIPVDFATRIYPFKLKNAKDLVPDEDGILTIMGGDMGGFNAVFEEKTTDYGEGCGSNCELTKADIDAIFDYIDEALKIKEPGKFAKLNTHVQIKELEESNEEIFIYFLSGLKKYVDSGQLVWATQLEAYEAYIASLK